MKFILNVIQNFIEVYTEKLGSFELNIILFIILLFILIAFLVGYKALGIGSVKVKAELFNVKDETILGEGKEIIGGEHYHTKTYMFGVKIPSYRYEYEGKLYINSPRILVNTPKHNPLPGPCEIYINKKKPWKIYDSSDLAMSKYLLFCALYTFIFVGVCIGMEYVDFSLLFH